MAIGTESVGTFGYNPKPSTGMVGLWGWYQPGPPKRIPHVRPTDKPIEIRQTLGRLNTILDRLQAWLDYVERRLDNS